MNKDIEKLIKISGKINKNKYHLCIDTNLEDKYRWVLFLYFPDDRDYFSSYNSPILDSDRSSIDELAEYLEKYDGLNKRW